MVKSKFNEDDYVSMKKNEGKVFNGLNHGHIVNDIMKKVNRKMELDCGN